MPRVEHEYKRILTPVSDQITLKEKGYTPFFSSNVSAGQRDGDDLFIRFHNGSIYQYPKQGKNFGDLLLSPSKGKWVWQNLRRKNVSFSKVGSFPLTGDRDLTDEELFTEIKKQKISIQQPLIAGLLSTIIVKEQSTSLLALFSREHLISSGIIAIGLANIIKGT